jgi:hypothetical protein
MLRVIRTELYFDPLKIKWSRAELVFGNPGISMAFFRCHPEAIDWQDALRDVLSSPLSVFAHEPLHIVRAFIDAALQREPFNAYGYQTPVESNRTIVDEILREPIIIENSPPEGVPFQQLFSGASIASIGTYVGLRGLEGGPLLFLAVPAGILVVGAAISISRAIDKGLNHAMERAIMKTKSKSKARPKS